MLQKFFFRLLVLFAAAAPSLVSVGRIDASSHIFVILMENHNWSSIKGNPDASYINNTLLPIASYTDQYYNPPGIHPSEPNYLWLEAGTNFGITNDNLPSSNHQATTSHLVTLLQNAGVSWRTYQEGITGTNCPSTNSYPYAPKHNPFVYFDDVTSGGCTTTMRPFTELANDLANNATAHYSFITPNLIDDMHDSAAPLNSPVMQGDTWLAQNVPMILNSSAYQNNGLVLITWDEGVGGDGPIGLIALSPLAKGGGYHNSVHYTHSSTLRTLQKIFGVSPLLGGAAAAVDLSDLFVADAIPNADNQIAFQDITYTSGLCSLSWLGEQGITYRVQWKSDLSGIWQTITPDEVGSGNVLSWTDDGSQTASAPSGQRFYRITIP
ncbi:MAG: alkaline phosphatase family protein [Verrucomicrobiota bacterium]|nr:alkaline phosphatase family protein [Verrucomicrobiota bacterium]